MCSLASGNTLFSAFLGVAKPEHKAGPQTLLRLLELCLPYHYLLYVVVGGGDTAAAQSAHERSDRYGGSPLSLEGGGRSLRREEGARVACAGLGLGLRVRNEHKTPNIMLHGTPDFGFCQLRLPRIQTTEV